MDKKMSDIRILYIHATIPNYLTDSLFYGLRQLIGDRVVDIPRNDVMYDDATLECLNKTGNRGKVLYGLLGDSPVLAGKRCFWQRELDTYDLIVFADIYHTCDIFNDIFCRATADKIVIVDGYDSAAMFPYMNMNRRLSNKPWSFFYDISKVKYFKREYESEVKLRGIKCNALNFIFNRPDNIFSISMSIPAFHIEHVPVISKTKKFVDYIVDEEVAREENVIEGFAKLGDWNPTFHTEKSYMDDVRKSVFGVTTKRGGWDCLRHYEYASKGTILCFKQLDKKHLQCAPDGLNERNCIVYANYQDLNYKIDSLSPAELQAIQSEAYRWVGQHTSEEVAKKFIRQLINN